MKTFSIFIEDLQADKEEFDALADYDMGVSKINSRVSDLEVAHGMALTTISFEFECYMDINSFLSNEENRDVIDRLNNNMFIIDLDNKKNFTYNKIVDIINIGFKYGYKWSNKFDYLIKLENPVNEDRIAYLLDHYNTLFDIVKLFDLSFDTLIPGTHLLNIKDGKVLHYNTIRYQLSKVFNTIAIDISSNDKFKIAHPTYWFIEKDGSLNDSPDTHIPVEIISPWIPAKDAVKFVTKFRNEVGKPFDIVTNDTTSMHCSFRTHITERDDEKVPLMLDVLKLLALLDEKKHLDRFNRFNNHYTQQIQSKLFSGIINTNDLDKLKKEVEIALRKNNKYSAINFTDFLTDYNVKTGNGRMEIRIIGDDYMGSLFNKAMKSLNEFILLISSALDNDLHDKEYKDNLNKKMKQFIDDIKETCNKYLNPTNNYFSIPDSFKTLYSLLYDFNKINDISQLDDIESLLIKVFTKLSHYIDIEEGIKSFIDDHHNSNEFIHDLYMGYTKNNKIHNAIFTRDKPVYICYEVLSSWYDADYVYIEDIDKLVFNITKLNESNKNEIIASVKQAFKILPPINTTSTAWEDLIDDMNKNKYPNDMIQLFNELFSTYITKE